MVSSIMIKDRPLPGRRVALVAAMIALIVLSTGAYSYGARGRLETFSTPESAFAALVGALKTGDSKSLGRILGAKGEQLVFPAGDSDERVRFLESYDEKKLLERDGPKRAMLLVGRTDWPWPIPVVKVGKRWHFDVDAGRKEILSRRIGRNEVGAVQVCLAYVDAQREYADNHETGGLFEYAQSFKSVEGAAEGLCGDGEADGNALGPLVGRACTAECPASELQPYHGYFYKILKKQGANAPGGAYDYVVADRMIAGFALVAYPASYGSTGVKTFIVNHQGLVYEKDLGRNSGQIAEAMTTFDPDGTWKVVK
jgi:hypothetical protein